LKTDLKGDKSSNLQTPFVPSSLQNIFQSSKGSKDMYTILNKNSSVSTAQRKWNTVLDINSNEWKQIYANERIIFSSDICW
jgi:hypothetical protein